MLRRVEGTPAGLERHPEDPGWQEMPDANNRRIALCPECVRRNLWLIEARLDVDPGSGF